MRVILGLLLVVGLMMFAGWLSIDSDGEATTATFDQTEAKEDTADAIRKGKDLLNKTERAIEESVEEAETDVSTDVDIDAEEANSVTTDEDAEVLTAPAAKTEPEQLN